MWMILFIFILTRVKQKRALHEVENVLATGSFKVKEWLCSTAIESNNENDQPKPKSVSNYTSTAPVVNVDGKEENKTLGVVWNPKKDVIGFASREV